MKNFILFMSSKCFLFFLKHNKLVSVALCVFVGFNEGKYAKKNFKVQIFGNQKIICRFSFCETVKEV